MIKRLSLGLLLAVMWAAALPACTEMQEFVARGAMGYCKGSPGAPCVRKPPNYPRSDPAPPHPG